MRVVGRRRREVAQRGGWRADEGRGGEGGR